jgi:hypothetical protein
MWLLFLALVPSRTFSVQDPGVSLSLSILTNGLAQLILTGESGVSYVIEVSSDLQNWNRLVTNNMSTIIRTIVVDARVLVFSAPEENLCPCSRQHLHPPDLSI